MGISDADQAKLFRLFGKLSDAKSINTSGIGLGLNICKKIVQSFGGHISVSSEVNVGTTFTFTFRVATPASSLVSQHHIILEEEGEDDGA